MEVREEGRKKETKVTRQPTDVGYPGEQGSHGIPDTIVAYLYLLIFTSCYKNEDQSQRYGSDKDSGTFRHQVDDSGADSPR